jgi:hypothetical protein
MQCITVDVFVFTVWWFSSGTPVSSTNKTDRHDIRDRALFTCGDGPVHSYFFLPKIFMSIHHIFKKKFMPINLIVYKYNIVNILCVKFYV